MPLLPLPVIYRHFLAEISVFFKIARQQKSAKFGCFSTKKNLKLVKFRRERTKIESFTIALLSFALVIWLLIAFTIFVSYLMTPFLRRSRGEKPKRAPLVSIIVPAKDEEYNIGTCLKLLLNQDYPNFEIIVVDDRSTDKTFEICKKFEAGDSRVRVIQIRDLPPGWTGKSHAVNEGIKLAKGELLLFIDADTDHDPECITTSVVQLEL